MLLKLTGSSIFIKRLAYNIENGYGRIMELKVECKDHN